MASTDALPVPQKNVAYRHYFAIRDNTGALVTSWTGMDSEVSKDGATMADCTNESVEIATTTGCGYIDLTSTEMNADSVVLKVTVTNTDALPYVVALFPEEAGNIRVDVTMVSGDATAADNMELMFDGTGYAGGTTPLQTNMIQISGDATAADNLELAFDGTGYAFTGCTMPTCTTLTNLPAITAGWLTAAGIAASALDGKGNWVLVGTSYTYTNDTSAESQDVTIT